MNGPGPLWPNVDESGWLTIVEVLASVIPVAGGLKAKREALMEALCARLHLDGWLWALSYLADGTDAPQSVDWQSTIKQRRRRGFAIGLRSAGLFGVPPENAPLAELTRTGGEFVRSIYDLVSAREWQHGRMNRAYVKWMGIDEYAYAIRPLRRDGPRLFFAGVVVGRAVGAERLTRRDLEVLHAILAHVDFLYDGVDPVPRARRLAPFTAAERLLIPMLREGLANAEMAVQTGKSVSTINKQVDSMRAKVNVSTRIQLVVEILGDEWVGGASGDGPCEPG